MELTIEGKFFIKGEFINCCIGIDQGRITEIKKILKADRHLNFGNKLILPAGVDMHVHFRDPGMKHKEDFSTGSISAAFGGITSVFDMPNTIPPTTTMQSLSDKIQLADKKSYADFGIYAGLTNNNIGLVGSLAKKCNGFKIYLGSTTNSMKFDVKNLKNAFKNISSTGKPVLIHCEDETCLNNHVSTEESLVDHLRSRPYDCEVIAIKNVVQLISDFKAGVHICHLSSCEGLELLKSHRRNNISIGATPHHLLFSVENKLAPQSFFKVNPPIRSSFDRESLFDGFKNGLIDVLESDHAPHSVEEKESDFCDAPSGIPGVETMIPLFLSFVKKDILSFQRLISAVCEKPAEILGIPKGGIEVGKDADFMVVDLRNEVRIKSDLLHSKCGWSPYENMYGIFPEVVFLRGEKLIEDGEIQVSQGFGKLVGE